MWMNNYPLDSIHRWIVLVRSVMRQLFLSRGVSPPGICFGCGAILRASLVKMTWQISGSSDHRPLEIPYVPHVQDFLMET